jgi:hypothetical protein
MVNVLLGRFALVPLAILLVALGSGSTKAQAISAGSAGLVISELMYNPQGTDDFEYIEFYNAGASSISLVGFELVRDEKRDGLDYTFGVEVLQPGEFILVTEDTVQFIQRYMTLDSPYYREGLRIAGQWKGGLGNSGEKLQVQDPEGNLIIKFSYGIAANWPQLASGMGSSLELVDSSAFPTDFQEREKFLESPGNWRASSEFHGNPGRTGKVPVRRVVINEVLANTDGQITDTIELFNSGDAAAPVGGWFLSDSTTFDKFRIPDGTIIPSRGFVSFNEQQFNPNGEWNPTAGVPSAKEFSLSGSKGDVVWLVEADSKGNALRVLDKVEFGPSRSGMSFGRWPDGVSTGFHPLKLLTLDASNTVPWSGPVVISEVQYNPGSQVNAESLEFIEVHNSGQSKDDLGTWALGGGVEFLFPAGTFLSPGDHLVIVGFDPADPLLLQIFRDYYGLDVSIPIIGPWKGGLSNSGETLYLKRRDVTAIKVVDGETGKSYHPLVIEDVVPYADGGPWPGRADGQGPSLERLDFSIWGGEPENWRASKEFKGNPGTFGSGAGSHIIINEVLSNSGISGGSKIDQYVLNGIHPVSPTDVPTDFVTQFIGSMQSQPFHFSLLHLAGPDASGHGSGWGTDSYKSSIEAVDAELGRIFEMLENTATLQGKTALILTSDHGGGGGWLMGHTTATHPDNFTIPFYVWGPGVAKTDLYALNQSTRTDPASDNNPVYLSKSSTMPIRNGAVANLALSLLKLPPVPGSWINFNQNLVVGDSSGIEFVIAISVDGLRPKEIQELGEEKLPNLYRFRKEGAWTDNARADVTHTLTLPNHTCMITGRGVQDVEGVGQGHRQTANYYSTGTLHQNIGGVHMASIYDIVHDNGLRTGLFANKSKFNLFKASYENVDAGISDSIELFNPTGADVDLGGWFLSDSEKNLKKYQIPEGTVLQNGDYLVLNEKNFNPGYGTNPTDFALSGSNGDEIFLSQADSIGNLIRSVDSVDFGPSPEGATLGRDSNGGGSFRAQAEPSLGNRNGEYRVGDLVLNEVMYLPNGSDDLEYLELYNTGGETMYWDNWTLEGVGEFTFPQGQTLGPKSLLVLLRFDPASSANISRKTAFEEAYGVTVGSQFVGGYPGGLGNSSDELKISRPGERFYSEPDRFPIYLEDEVAYTNLAPWPKLQPDQTLHRSNPKGWGSRAANWSAGAPSPGSLAVQESFKEWAASRLPGIEEPNVEDDPDLDDLSNLLEFALGLNPAMKDVDALPFIEKAAFDGLVTFIYQLDRAAGGIDFRIEYTRGLATGWQNLAAADFAIRDELVDLKETVETRKLLLPASEKILFLRILIDR